MKKKKISPWGGEDKPDNDLQQLNKAPVWQRWIDNTHKTCKQTAEPALSDASTNEAERENVFNSLLPIQIGAKGVKAA